MLWTAQGAFMLAYSTEKSKGRYIAFFWAIFNVRTGRSFFQPSVPRLKPHCFHRYSSARSSELRFLSARTSTPTSVATPPARPTSPSSSSRSSVPACPSSLSIRPRWSGTTARESSFPRRGRSRPRSLASGSPSAPTRWSCSSSPSSSPPTGSTRTRSVSLLLLLSLPLPADALVPKTTV